MPRYFLEITNGDTHSDPTGIDLADLDAAREHALAIVETMLLDDTPKDQPWKVVIADEAGNPLETVRRKLQ